jgi:proteasomal ATPase-associated factor 1
LTNPVVYGDIDVYKANNQTELRGLGSLVARQSAPRELIVSYNSREWLTRFPKNSYSQLYSNPLHFTTIDVSPENQLLILGTSNGGLQVVTADNGTVRRQLEGHFDHTVVAKFFPSGQAAVSAGIDMRIKIWNLADSSNPRTLTGHTGSPVDIAIIGRGRNIVSGSTDSTIRLWECGSGQSIHTFKCESSVTALALADFNRSSDELPPRQNAPFEYDTDSKAIFAADMLKTYLFDLRSKEVQQAVTSHDITALATNGEMVVLGSKNGVVTAYDCRDLTVPLFTFTKSDQEIKQLLLRSSILTIISEDSVSISLDVSEKSGLDCPTYLITSDPVNAGVINSHGLYFAGKNGMVRYFSS